MKMWNNKFLFCRIFSCLTLNTFICQRKIQIVLKKLTTFKKCANAGCRKCAKSWRQDPWNFKTIQPSHGVNGLAHLSDPDTRHILVQLILIIFWDSVPQPILFSSYGLSYVNIREHLSMDLSLHSQNQIWMWHFPQMLLRWLIEDCREYGIAWSS